MQNPFGGFSADLLRLAGICNQGLHGGAQERPEADSWGNHEGISLFSCKKNSFACMVQLMLQTTCCKPSWYQGIFDLTGFFLSHGDAQVVLIQFDL